MSKICNKCKVDKPLTEYYKRKKGVRHICKACQKIEAEIYIVKPKTILKKVCTKCGINKDINEFFTQLNRADGHRSNCKACSKMARHKSYEKHKESETKKAKLWQKNNPEKVKVSHRKSNQKRQADGYFLEWSRENKDKVNATRAKYRAAKLKRTPKWVNLEAIKQFYRKCPKNMQVDHIIPLQGITVSGFHVLTNLQYLTKTENCRKSNKY